MINMIKYRASDSLLPTHPFLLSTVYLGFEGFDLVLKRFVGLLIDKVSSLLQYLNNAGRKSDLK